MAQRLREDFYMKTDAIAAAKALLGTVLVTEFNGRRTSGIITETEAYVGPEDKASHAYGNRRTKRTETMFREGGVAYIYLCYGIYHLFNVVVGRKDWPAAVLVRAIKPVEGVSYMLERRNKLKKSLLTNGPGKLTEGLGITTAKDGCNLIKSHEIWIEERTFSLAENEIKATKRIGVDYAGQDALLPYRFLIKDTGGNNKS